jgi:hypothetical protein
MLDRPPEDNRLQFVPQDQRPPMTPQLARRVGLAGVVALSIFAIVGLRLWYLQVLSGDRYLVRADVNRVREIEFAAPRGQILDRSGNLLVDSRAAIAVQVSPPDLPVPLTPSTLTNPPVKDVLMYNRLAWVLGMPTRRRVCRVVSHQARCAPSAPFGCRRSAALSPSGRRCCRMPT